MTDTQRNTGIGAGVGALAGAAIGSATGGTAVHRTAAVLGALAGAARRLPVVAAHGKPEAQMEAATQGTGVAVTQTAEQRARSWRSRATSPSTWAASAIKPNFAPVLDQFANGLRNNPNAEVRIIGHTDSTGTDAINNPLSVERAASTATTWWRAACQRGAFRTEGRGSREPTSPTTTAKPAGRRTAESRFGGGEVGPPGRGEGGPLVLAGGIMGFVVLVRLRPLCFFCGLLRAAAGAAAPAAARRASQLAARLAALKPLGRQGHGAV